MADHKASDQGDCKHTRLDKTVNQVFGSDGHLYKAQRCQSCGRLVSAQLFRPATDH